jgi:hypothetical protein
LPQPKQVNFAIPSPVSSNLETSTMKTKNIVEPGSVHPVCPHVLSIA